MGIILYFVARSSAERVPIPEGVSGAEVQNLDFEGVTAYYSKLEKLPQHPTDVAEQCTEFSRVQRQGFSFASIVPFRFPSTLEDETLLFKYLESEAEVLRRALSRVDGKSQFDFRLTSAEPSVMPSSGTEYLRNKAQQKDSLVAVERACREELEELVCEWRVEAERGRRVLHALVPRSKEVELAQRLRRWRPPGGQRMTASGPWPAGAFVNALESEER